MAVSMLSMAFRWGCLADFDGVIWVGWRETQDTRCGIDLPDVRDGDRFDARLAWLGCCAILVRDGVVDYCGHCSFDGNACEIRLENSGGDGWETVSKHGP